MKLLLAILTALAAFWTAVGGGVELVRGTGVVEVLCIELIAVVLGLLSLGFFVAAYRSPGCTCPDDCSDVRGGPR